MKLLHVYLNHLKWKRNSQPFSKMKSQCIYWCIGMSSQSLYLAVGIYKGSTLIMIYNMPRRNKNTRVSSSGPGSFMWPGSSKTHAVSCRIVIPSSYFTTFVVNHLDNTFIYVHLFFIYTGRLNLVYKPVCMRVFVLARKLCCPWLCIWDNQGC